MKKLFRLILLAAATLMPVLPGRAVVIVDDTWADGSRTNTPISSSNTVWYASTTTSLLVGPNYMLGTNITSARMWVGYFTEDPASPVTLNDGEMIKVTLVFTPTNVAAWPGSGTARGLRFGLFNYADGGTRLTNDVFSSSGGNGGNVTGYMLNMSFFTNFSVDTPLQILVRTNLPSANLMGTTVDYITLGSGPCCLSNQPGFSSGVTYTLEFAVARTNAADVGVYTRISGADQDLQFSIKDTITNYYKFDTFAIRPNNLAQSADHFTFHQFKVEVLPIATPPLPPFSITSIERLSPGNVKVTFESVPGKTYVLESRDQVNTGAWTTNAVGTATGTSMSLTNSGIPPGVTQRFYRVGRLP
ncbi:MAG: hypothetical protein RMK20_08465 [Verrucomicrobiales bacterium]|nr:hypothetical protein [Verrucomicrobiales bacterium]